MPELPPRSDAIWNKLVSGQITHKFALFAANMAVAHTVRIAAQDPGQKPALIEELYRFCCKYAAQVAREVQALR